MSNVTTESTVTLAAVVASLAIGLLALVFPPTASAQTPLGLSVVTANMAGAADLPQTGGPGSINWRTRYDRFAASIASSGAPPDLISITEVSGWESCVFPIGRSIGDYDGLDVLIDGLARRTGVVYRLAYMVGRSGGYGPGNRCQTFVGDAVLYNPGRLANRTPDDANGRSLAAHDAAFYGVQLRRSLPLCNRGSRLRPLETLIDGARQSEKCGAATPTGPAWALVLRGNDDKGQPYERVEGSLARFSYTSDPGASFDVFTLHPSLGAEAQLVGPIQAFIQGTSVSPYRVQPTMIETLVLGDMNMLRGTAWLPGFKELYAPGEDLLAIMQGVAGGVQPKHHVFITARAMLPLGGLPQGATECGKQLSLALAFADHCALRGDFAERVKAFTPPARPVPLPPAKRP